MTDLERALSSLQQLMLPTGFMHVRWRVMLAVNVVMQPGSIKTIIIITVTVIIIIIIIIIIISHATLPDGNSSRSHNQRSHVM